MNLNLNELLEKGNLISYYREYDAPPFRKGEALRYSGISGKIEAEDWKLDRLLADCFELAKQAVAPKVVYAYFPLTRDEEGYPILPFYAKSNHLKKNLDGCDGVILFAASIGAGTDRLVMRYNRTEPTKGLLISGIGSERVESLCDAFCLDLKNEAAEAGYRTHPRYSPGYGVLPITVQPEFLKLLNAEKMLGITLNASYLMSPSKSVTAIIGLEKTKRAEEFEKG